MQTDFLAYADNSNIKEPSNYAIGASHGHCITSVDVPLAIPWLPLRISLIGHFVVAARLPGGPELPVRNEVSSLAVSIVFWWLQRTAAGI